MEQKKFYKALESYLHEEGNRIYRLAYSYVKNEEDALDVVQAAMLKALTTKNPCDIQYLKTWLYRIVVNAALDFLRSRKRYTEFTEQISEEFKPVSVSKKGISSMELEDSLSGLSFELRTIVVLHLFAGFTLHEVAEILEMNSNTVKTKYYRALKLLRLELNNDDE